jgi:Leucine-rich repeat (LRR) protein
MSELALRLIAENKRTKNPVLDLGSCGLTELPKEVLELTHLQELNLKTMFYSSEKDAWVDCGNRGGPNVINSMPDLGSLVKLRSLKIGGWYSEFIYFYIWNLKTLDFIKNNVELHSLHCDGISVSDLGPLSPLTALQQLNFTGNQVSDLGPLSPLAALQELYFSENQVSDLGPLSPLTALQQLVFNENQVSDLGPLRTLTALKQLNFSYNEVSDLIPLSTLTALQQLVFNDNQVSDLRPLSTLTALQKLNFDFNQVSDLNPLSTLTALQKLFFFDNQVSDLGPLSRLTALQQLKFDCNEVSDLSPLSTLTALQELYFSKHNVPDLNPLSTLTALQQLDCGNNQVSDLSPLSTLTALQQLDFGYNQVSDLSPLSPLTALEVLNLCSNKVSDLGPLSPLNTLQTLVFGTNQVSDLGPLSTLTALRRLAFTNNQVSDLSPIKNLILDGVIDYFSVFNNPLQNPPLEIAEKGLEAVRNYFVQAQKWDVVDCSDIKVIFLGNSTSGKTTLANMLVHEKFKEVPSTHGILNDEWNIETGASKGAIKATLWDFGGQEYYHATHRLFLSPNSVYVLVASKSSEFEVSINTKVKVNKINDSGEKYLDEVEVKLQQHTYPYWLKTIEYYMQSFRAKQTVFLVESKTQNPKITFAADDQLYPGLHFPEDPFRIDSEQAFYQKSENGKGYRQFLNWKESMRDLIFEKLKGNTIISVFPVIRDALAQVASTMTSEQSPEELNALCRSLNIEPPDEWPVLAPWITFEEYESFVRQYFFKGDPEEDIVNLTLYLQHSCSRVLHFDNIGVNGKICIDPFWLHKHIYDVLNPEIKEADGLFDIEHVDRKMPGGIIEASDMVEIMKAYRLIFELPRINEEDVRQFIAPQYLPNELNHEKQIVYKTMMNRFKFEPALYIQFNHLLPSAVISQFISSVGYRANDDLLWKQGVVYERSFSGEKENIIVKANSENRELEIWLEQKLNPIAKTVIIADIVEQIVSQNKDQESSILLRLPEHEPIRFQEVKDWVKDRKRHHNTLCDHYEKYVNNDKLLKVFVSYAHAQTKAFECLVNSLKSKWLVNFLIEIVVISDLDIALNVRWHEFIQYELNRCDIFIGCLSQDYIMSQYINEYEIKTIQRHLDTKALELSFINMSGHLADHQDFYFQHQRFQPTYRDLNHPTDKPNDIVFIEEIYQNEELLRSYITRLMDKLKPAIDRVIERKIGKNNRLN